jgi:hypothetical protein
MALYIPHSIFHLARLLYVRPETFGPYDILFIVNFLLSVSRSFLLHFVLCKNSIIFIFIIIII